MQLTHLDRMVQLLRLYLLRRIHQIIHPGSLQTAFRGQGHDNRSEHCGDDCYSLGPECQHCRSFELCSSAQVLGPRSPRTLCGHSQLLLRATNPQHPHRRGPPDHAIEKRLGFANLKSTASVTFGGIPRGNSV